MAINLPTGFFRTTNEPLDVRYLASGLTPYSSVAAANTAITSAVRYIGQFVNVNNQLYWYQNGITDGDLVAFSGGGGGGSGTVTSVSVTTANGVSGTVSNPTTTPAIQLSLGAITPSSVAATGTVSGSNLSGTNTGDQDLSNLVVKNATITGATKTKITYDSKGLVTSGSDATTADIADTTDKRYQTDNQKLYNDATSSIQTQLNSKVTGVTASSPITSSGGTTPVISTSMSTNKLIGRSTAGTGAMEEISVGTGLSLSGGTLSSTSTGSGILNATASGTDTYTATVSGVTSYNNGDAYLIRFTNGNTTTCTLNINSIGAIPLYKNNNGALIGGDILDGGEMLCVYNSTLAVFQCIGTSPNTLLAYVTNDDSVTITKGQPVYAFSGTGDRLTVKRAYNTTDATSAQTVGIVLSSSIAANQKGFIIIQGLLDGLSTLPTSTWADGDPVYLGATAGTITKTKPYAPNHLVYLGVVTTASNGSAGRMYVRVQNGYELDELHNVQAQSPTVNDILYYFGGSPGQWKTASIPTVLGYTPANASTAVTSVTGTSPIVSSGGTTPAISLPVATSSANGYLSSTDWSTFNNKLTANSAIVSATKTKITYDTKGLVTSGADATTADIADSLNKRYVTDAQLVVIGNTSGVNTGDQTLSGLGGVPTSRTISTTSPLTGGGDLSANRTLSIPQATSSVNGYLSSADWSTFNSKEPALAKGNLTETASSVLTITNGTNAVIGSGTTIKVSQASGTTSGYLSSTDWTTFNNKGNGTVTSIVTNSPITGGTITGTGSIGIQDAVADGTTKGAATFETNDFNSSSGLISIDYTNGQAASAIKKGFLTAADWSTFNGKQNTLIFGNLSESVSSVLTISGGTGSIIGSGVSIQVAQASGSTNGYLTSTDWNSFNSKVTSVSGSSPIASTGGATPTISIPKATSTVSGYLSSTDWNTFNNKQNTITQGNLSETVSNVLTISGGTNAVIGSGTTIQMTQSSSITDGYLSSTDWNTFNNKQNALTNPVTGTGTSGQVTYWNGTTTQTGSSNLVWDSTNNRLGINNGTPSYALDVSGTVKSNTVRVDNIGSDTFQIYDGVGVKQLYIDSTNQLAFNATSGPIYFGTFGAPTFGRAGFSIPGSVVMVVDAVTARAGFGGGINLVFNSPDALVEIQGKTDEKQLSVKGNPGQSSDIAEFKANGSKTVYVDSTGRLVSTSMAVPTSAPAGAIAGSMYFDTTTNFLFVHNGTNWVSVMLT